MQRSHRREMLTGKKDIELRGIKDNTLHLTKELADNREALIEAIERHFVEAIVPDFHQTVIAVRLLNADEIISSPRIPERIDCHLAATIRSQDGAESLEISSPLTTTRDSPRHSEYFEAIIQLRGMDAASIDEMRRYLTNSGLTIAKHENTKDGIDLYIDDSHRAQSLMTRHKRAHGGDLTVSKRLHGVDKMTSKKKYRVTILYRPSV